MGASDVDLALRWLAASGLTPLAPGRWRDLEGAGRAELSDEDVAFGCAYEIVSDESVSAVGRVRTALGLLDLTGAFEVLTHLNEFVRSQEEPAVGAAFWAGCRARLEVDEPIESLRLSLRTYWFIGDTAAGAFDVLIGDDVRRLVADGRLAALARGPLHRRAGHVLEDSGAVGWTAKRDILRAAATVAELHPAVFRGLRSAYHEVYGDLQPAEALAILERLRLPAGTAGVGRLRAVLGQGARNHYDNPALWGGGTAALD